MACISLSHKSRSFSSGSVSGMENCDLSPYFYA